MYGKSSQLLYYLVNVAGFYLIDDVSKDHKKMSIFVIFQHLYPKSQIDVFVTVLQNDGSVLASSITCAGMALIDASIHVFDVIIGSSMVRMTLNS